MLLGELAALLGARCVDARVPDPRSGVAGAEGTAGDTAVGGGTTALAGRAEDTRVADVEQDSRLVTPGSLFACIPGAAADGHEFAPEAVAAGACALLVERDIAAGVPLLVVESTRRAVGHAAAAVHGNPSRRLRVAGVTGTDGKTTTVRLLAEVLRAGGPEPLEIGTLTGDLTTPEATELQRRLARAAVAGFDTAALEVSSHALAQHRLNGCRLRVAAFTNLGHDHLDYHGSVEEYFGAKARLFSSDLAEQAVIDVTTGWGRRMAALAAREMPVVEVDRREVELVATGARSSAFRWRGLEVSLPLAGAFNVANAVLAAEIAVALGVTPAAAAAALARARPVPGRFESVAAGQDFTVIVDYAHTPCGLGAALRAARLLTERRLIVVFGAGGDRDRAKRPEMGRIAEGSADHVILTSDNPRSEDPERIIDEIASGMRRAPGVREADRRLALRQAVAMARSGDTVLVAGRGHEAGQTVGDRVLAFDDRQVVVAEIRRLLGARSASGRADRASGRADRASGRADRASGRADRASGRADRASGRADRASGRADGDDPRDCGGRSDGGDPRDGNGDGGER